MHVAKIPKGNIVFVPHLIGRFESVIPREPYREFFKIYYIRSPTTEIYFISLHRRFVELRKIIGK